MQTAKTTQMRTASTSMIGRARPEVVQMKGYSSARSLSGDEAGLVYLDANECAYEPFVGARNLARYSAQQPTELQRAFCDWLDVSSRNLTITRGADEAIDCLIRSFCEPGADNIVICPPTFAMYAQSAMVQSVEVRHAPLTVDFGLDTTAIALAMDEATKLVFVCSPNNPTGNVMNADAIAKHFYEQGKADAIKGQVAKDKNINLNPRKTHGEVNAGGIKVKVLGDSVDDFKFKIKKRK